MEKWCSSQCQKDTSKAKTLAHLNSHLRFDFEISKERKGDEEANLFVKGESIQKGLHLDIQTKVAITPYVMSINKSLEGHQILFLLFFFFSNNNISFLLFYPIIRT